MPPTEKLSITLPHDMASMVREKVESGDYASNSEVIREALRLLQEQEALRAQKLAWLREKIVEGETSGEPLPADEVFDRLEARYAAMVAKHEG